MSKSSPIIISNLKPLFPQDNLPAEEGKMHVINLYFAADHSGEIKLNEESSDFVWADPSELSEYRIAFQNDEAIKKYLEEK